MLLMTRRPVLLTVVYYMPDYPSLMNEFMWQTEDMVPQLRRIHKFLNHWKDNIEAPIHEILLSVGDNYMAAQYRSVDHFLEMN